MRLGYGSRVARYEGNGSGEETSYEGYGSREETHITIAFNYLGSLWYHLRMESATLHPM